MNRRGRSKQAVQQAENLTRVYTYVRDYILEFGYSPSLMDIAEACYLSRGSVVRYLDILVARGKLNREPGVPRSIHLLDEDGHRL